MYRGHICNFDGDGEFPEDKDLLKREHKGDDSSCDNSFKMRSLRPSGPDALSVFRVLRISSTS